MKNNNRVFICQSKNKIYFDKQNKEKTNEKQMISNLGTIFFCGECRLVLFEFVRVLLL